MATRVVSSHFPSLCLLTGCGSRCGLRCKMHAVPSPRQGPESFHATPPHNVLAMSDQWQQQHDPVGNKGYEVWQQCASWSPSSCLFLQAMGKQSEKWKNDPYIDFRVGGGGEDFVGPSGNSLMNRRSAYLASCRWRCEKDSSPPVDMEVLTLKWREGNFGKHN